MTQTAKEVIYLIMADLNPPMYKIGRTRDLTTRIKSLCTGSPVALSLVGYLEGSALEEREIHQRFGQYRSHGEWFAFDDEILSTVKQVFAGRHSDNDTNKPTRTITLRVPKSEHKLFAQEALNRGISVNDLIRTAGLAYAEANRHHLVTKLEVSK